MSNETKEEPAYIKVICASVLAVLSLVPHPTAAQAIAKNLTKGPIETDICQILSKPYAYNKIVKVRGYLQLGWEYSMFVDERCDALWLASFGDDSFPPQLIATVDGSGTSGDKDANGRRTPPMPIHLVRDSNWKQLENYMNHKVKAENCMKGPAPDWDYLSDCTTYRITATFIGRIDAISKAVYDSRIKRKDKKKLSSEGFGQMGLFDAQIVVKAVEDIVVTDESEIRPPVSSSH